MKQKKFNKHHLALALFLITVFNIGLIPTKTLKEQSLNSIAKIAYAEGENEEEPDNWIKSFIPWLKIISGDENKS